MERSNVISYIEETRLRYQIPSKEDNEKEEEFFDYFWEDFEYEKDNHSELLIAKINFKKATSEKEISISEQMLLSYDKKIQQRRNLKRLYQEYDLSDIIFE
jgi:hypothetical protein